MVPPRREHTPDEIIARRNALEGDLAEIFETYGITTDRIDLWNEVWETIAEYETAKCEYELAMKVGRYYELAKRYLQEEQGG